MEPKLKQFTIDDVLALNLCNRYTREYVTKLFAGRKTIDILDAHDMGISWEDQRWFTAKTLTHRQNVLWSCLNALSVIENFEKLFPNDNGPRAAIEAALAWAIIPSASAARAAYSAAYSAYRAAYSADSTAASAARAAYSAAYSAYSAAYSAAYSVDRAAYSAAYSADRENEKEIQYLNLCEVLLWEAAY